jgi:site-specific DNA-methyltransferase (adenine-specific)
MDLMATLPDKSIDLAIVDPPYFNGPQKLGYYGAGKSKTGVNRPQYNTPRKWDVPTNEYYKELCRVSKNQIIWGINYFRFENVPVGRIVWDKMKNEFCTFSGGEIASCSLIDTVRFFRYRWDGFLQDNMKNKEKKIHPTQKPVALYKYSLKFAKQGDKILDTHFGSGSIVVACYDMGFDLVASEIDEDYFKAAVDRLKLFAAQGTLDFQEAI